MAYKIIRHSEIPKKEKFDIKLDIYPSIGDAEIVIVETEKGHNQEFYDKRSTYNYIVLAGEGSFFLDDEELPVKAGDMLTIKPNTRIYYKGKMRLALITTPPWSAENEVETKASIW